jgi:hypothetical protein
VVSRNCRRAARNGSRNKGDRRCRSIPTHCRRKRGLVGRDWPRSARAIELMALCRVCVPCRAFPFRFGGQAGSCPCCKGVGFIEADMADRCGRINRTPPIKTGGAPSTIFPAPVHGSGDAPGLSPGPAVRQPEAWLIVAAIGDKGSPFVIGHHPVGQSMGAA